MPPLPAPSLALLLALAAPQPSPAGRVDAGGGITFELPRRFAVEAEESEEGTVHAATRRDGEAAVSAGVLAGVEEFGCASGDQQARGLRSFRTGRGLRACAAAAAAEAEDGSDSLALAVALVEAGPAVVTIAARAPTEREASALARSVAETVAFAPERAARRPPGGWGRLEARAADPRLVGCYETFRDISPPLWISGARTRMRCLEADGTFREGSSFTARFGTFGEDGGAAATSEVASGTWSFDGERLTLAYEDGEAWEGTVELAESGFVVDGEEAWATR
jgi:hypothetical protein